jgi:hypothetical protein
MGTLVLHVWDLAWDLKTPPRKINQLLRDLKERYTRRILRKEGTDFGGEEGP